LLSKNDALSIKELSEQIEVSHPAASQLITNLKNRGLVTSATCADDGRRQLVTLTDSGRALLKQILPVWDAISQAMTQLVDNDAISQQLLPAITAVENTFRSSNLSAVISEKLAANLKPADHE
jgi:DNA-binding MarR family transcriptional regulator